MAVGRWALIASLACALATGWKLAVQAEERRVVDELLDILRQNKQITEEQYRSLKRRAEEERQEDLRKAGAPQPTPTAAAVVAAVSPTATPATLPLMAYFAIGFILESADKRFSLNIGGRLQADWNMSDPG